MAKRKSHPRIPVSSAGIQVNHCKNPYCENFGVPAAQTRGTKKYSQGREGYTVIGGSGRMRVLKCHACNRHTTLRSNAAIEQELARFLPNQNRHNTASCPNQDCTSFGIAVWSSPRCYYKHGKTSAGEPRYRCRTCGSTFSVGAPIRKQRLPHLNHQVLKLLVNKVPMRRICEVLDIRPATLYNKIAYLAEVTTAFVEEHELKLQHSEPPKARIYISIDRQDYSLNWGTHLDRRNIQLGAIGAVDNDSGYVLAMQLNFDSSLNAEDVEADAIKRGDYDLPPPYRHYARLWLRREYDASDSTLLHSDDTEVVEHVDPAIKGPHSGMQVHLEYTQYALFLHLKKLLQGVQKLRFFMDRDPGLDGACLAAFVEEVQQRRVDAFLVQSIKTLTMQKKKLLIAHKQREFDKFCADHPTLKKAEAKHEWVQEQLESYLAEKTDSHTWFNYPFPDMAEPGKTLLHLTDYGDYPLDHLARLYMRASLRGIDRFFMQVRRRLSILERPIATANNANRRWHGYAAYSPLVVEQVLRIFRAYYNYCLVGEDGETPAMRLKLTNQLVPLEVLAASSLADDIN